nr:MAG TPA: hypothetical protein [Bacteriophage sp.]
MFSAVAFISLLYAIVSIFRFIIWVQVGKILWHNRRRKSKHSPGAGANLKETRDVRVFIYNRQQPLSYPRGHP